MHVHMTLLFSLKKEKAVLGVYLCLAILVMYTYTVLSSMHGLLNTYSWIIAV